MKLNETFIVYPTEAGIIMLSTDQNVFSGVIRLNGSAAVIVDCLKNETTVEEIADTMCRKYDADRERIVKDIEKIIDDLRSISAISE